MKEKLIGREREVQELKKCYDSEKSEFVIVYGRRRIGKTFLVRSFFNNKFAFNYVGAHNYSDAEQLQNFAEALRQYSGALLSPILKNWNDAFSHLKELLSNLPSRQRKVVFIDEMPWIDSAKSGFVKALENFWNGWAAVRGDILFIACGSATSWMVDKIVENQGGLHNRITQQIYLRPFTLRETEQYLEDKGCRWDRLQILQGYMIMGGIPYYLSLVDPKQSLAQNIDRLFFAKNSSLRNEFSELYAALFSGADKYILVVKALAEKREGLSRTEIIQKSGVSGGWLTKILANLERCDFIISYANFGHKSKNTIYRLSDFYTLFYLKFIENDTSHDENRWTHLLLSPQISSWQGYTFELVCLLHLSQLKEALGISGILTEASSWRSSGEEGERTQIDLVIDRMDRVVNLCEMKFSIAPYIISREYEQKLRSRMAVFQAATHTRKALVTTLVTTYGVSPNKHSGIVQSEVTMDDLFR